MLSINAVKGFEIGDGFALARCLGSHVNDVMERTECGSIAFRTNHSGGIQGGISTGAEIRFAVAFKPTPTIALEQETLNLEGEAVRFAGTGRHDPCSCLSRRLPSLPLTQTKLPIPQASSYLLSTIPVFTIRGQYSASGGWLVRSIFLLLLFSTH